MAIYEWPKSAKRVFDAFGVGFMCFLFVNWSVLAAVVLVADLSAVDTVALLLLPLLLLLQGVLVMVVAVTVVVAAAWL